MAIVKAIADTHGASIALEQAPRPEAGRDRHFAPANRAYRVENTHPLATAVRGRHVCSKLQKMICAPHAAR